MWDEHGEILDCFKRKRDICINTQPYPAKIRPTMARGKERKPRSLLSVPYPAFPARLRFFLSQASELPAYGQDFFTII